ncbi:phospholipid-transporting ATPase ABCA3-like [Cavia porcellus]|uniref:phospholipid-transporting ATPase ABCA3-like n=1 Tax=Cavia porcellus TaxID=10141 RepID=UPI002FDF1082
MTSLEFKKLTALLWKNFTLKRRKYMSLVMEILLTVLFGISLLGLRNVLFMKKIGPFSFTAFPVNHTPSFIGAPVTFPYPWELAYVPSNSTVVQNIVANVKKDLNTNMQVVGFSSESKFDNYVKQINNSEKVLAAIVFDHDFQSNSDTLPLKVKYYLRFSYFKKNKKSDNYFKPDGWFTDSLFPLFSPLGPRNGNAKDGGSPGYISEGFLLVQHALDKAIMLHHSGTAAETLFNSVNIFVQRFPYPVYDIDIFSKIAVIFIPVIIACIFSMNHLTLLQSIVWEKENQLKEFQLIIGLSNWMLWTAYFITYLFFYLFNIIFMCIILFVKVEPLPIFQYSDPSLVFIFLLFYAISVIFFSFMISTFFDKATVAVFFGSFIFLIMYIPYTLLLTGYEKLRFQQKMRYCLSFNVAMAMGFKFLVEAEKMKTGIKWSNIFSSKGPDNFLFAYVMGMLLLDSFLYGLVAWYIEAVFPGKYGVPKPWNFFMRHSYWSGKKHSIKGETIQYETTIQSQYFEDEPTDLVAGIQIKHLHKVFKKNNTTKVAVKDLSLNLYEGQITVLLGHNGAGKSTTLSILSGLYPATSGKAYVSGYDVSQDMDQIRKSFGMCPQQNLLFDYLTVSEHLYFYCIIKGVPYKMCLKEIAHMLSVFKLLDKQTEFSKSLSGGMKRKLSLMIALIGGSKVLIIDEPTSDMDPLSRRATWDLLQNYKKDRTILLTTQYMDEADVLGDRIAIVVKGSLKCCGSSMFLKRLYGVGYHIVLVKAPHCDVEEISKLIHYYAPKAILESNVGTELSFILPKEYTDRFEELFTTLEKRQEELGINDFGASVTTMEEVFLKVTHMDSQTNIEAHRSLSQRRKVLSTRHNINMSSNVGRAHSLNENTTVFNTGCSLYRQQFYAMFLKKLLFTWRNWKLILLQILGLLVPTVLLFRNYDLQITNEKTSRQMNLSEYGQTIVPYSISGNSDLTTSFLKHLESMVTSENHILREVQGSLLKYLRENKECVFKCIIALSIEVRSNKTILTALFNNQAYHSPSLSLSVLDNILFMSLSGADASLTVINKPQPFSVKKNSERTERTVNGQQVAIKLQLGLAFLVSGFCFLTVAERITKSKHIQFLSGVSTLVYWLSALLYDFIIFFISCCLLLGIFKYYNIDIYIMDYHFLETMLIFVLYGWSSIPLIYLMSFLFSESTSAYIKLILFNYISGTYSILIEQLLSGEMQTTMSNATQTFLRNTLLLFPNYNLVKCISDYTVVYKMKILCSQKNHFLNCSKENTEKSIYSLENHMIGKCLIIMSILGFVFLIFIFLWENALWRLRIFIHQYIYFGIYKKYKKNFISKELSGKFEDKDVQNERTKILKHPQEVMKSPLLIKELMKIYFKYPVILAVKNISLAVQKRECFGLLGFNGAGKTTTFEILTGELSPTSGDVFIDGFNITKNNLKVRSRIGYCPQCDALLEYMTGREIITMYARVWGVAEHQIPVYVKKHLNSLELEPHANNLISTYSGGNKRRLNAVIAVMGKSSVVFLDEPSTGMDPVARRLLWNTVINIREGGKAVVITSHSMEECEALCTRLAIMVKGTFMCLGSPQYLKNKFGNFYILKVKLKTPDKLQDFKNFITMTFPDSILKEENQGILTYYIPRKDNSWGKVFGILEKVKGQFDLEDYSIGQITLEQVFLTFANPRNTADDFEEKVP